MISLSAISPTQAAYSLRPQAGVGVPDLGSTVQGLPEMPAEAGRIQKSGEGSFGEMLGRMVQDVNAKQTAASDAVAGLQSGQNVSLHQAVIAMEEANISFQLMAEVRNKLLESYQELMRMQI
jgi:flagellar hook-basal body complex protein FliE